MQDPYLQVPQLVEVILLGWVLAQSSNLLLAQLVERNGVLDRNASF